MSWTFLKSSLCPEHADDHHDDDDDGDDDDDDDEDDDDDDDDGWLVHGLQKLETGPALPPQQLPGVQVGHLNAAKWQTAWTKKMGNARVCNRNALSL